jgi:alpha-N-arabinofuranosidase
VIVVDANNIGAKLVYNDANNIVQQKEEFWHVWNIKLQDLKSGGVSLQAIKKIIIGFGNQNDPEAGGTGTVYFDDIKLAASAFAADVKYSPSSDLAGDASVNFIDLAEFAGSWWADSNDLSFCSICDLDGNGFVNFKDLAVFVSYWLWPPEQVTIMVDAGTIKGDISTKLTGTNTSWYYDNDAIWASGSMAAYLNEFGVGMLRYPGGVETSYLHWEIPYAHWKTDLWAPGATYTPTSAYMNTDDYIAKCRAVGAEPYIGINIKSGRRYNRIQDSINEAVRWVQYCRAQHYNVKYWYLENEPYYDENGGPMTYTEYAGYIAQFAPAMKAADPNIKIVINWENKLSVTSYWDAWKYIFETAGDYFDIADVHWYWAWDYATWDMWLNENPMKVREWCGDCSGSRYIGPSYADEIKGFYDRIKNINGKSYTCKLAAMEWNIAPTHDNRFSRFQHALMQSEMIGQFIEGGLDMACIWPLTWDGSLGGDFRTVLDDAAHQPTPSSWVFKLYKNALGQQLVAGTASLAHIRPVSVLSTDGNTLWVYLLHKSSEGDAARAQVSISGFAPVKAEAVALSATSLSSNVAGLQKIVIAANGNSQWECVLPPHSLTMLTFHKNN